MAAVSVVQFLDHIIACSMEEAQPRHTGTTSRHHTCVTSRTVWEVLGVLQSGHGSGGKTKVLLRCAAESVPPEAQGGHILIAAAFDSE